MGLGFLGCLAPERWDVPHNSACLIAAGKGDEDDTPNMGAGLKKQAIANRAGFFISLNLVEGRFAASARWCRPNEDLQLGDQSPMLCPTRTIS
jgi:hypothetical protein